MDPQLLFQPVAALDADTARRRASAVDPATLPSSNATTTTTAPATSGLSAEQGLPAIGSSDLGLASTPASAGFGSGGLGSSPNVPAPGTTINPATGLPHTAGLTRQELAAMKAQEEHARRLPELSGRQQAAAQLVGGGPVVAGQPASPTMSERSMIDDVTQRISTLGHKTYDALPPAIRDVFAEPKGKGPEGSPVKPRRGSAAAMFENVKNTASRLSHDFSQTVSNAIAEPEGYHPPGESASPSGRRGSQIRTSDKPPGAGSETSVYQQVKEFLTEAYQVPPAGGVPASTIIPGALIAGQAGTGIGKTLPSQENQGARPGEVSAGVGALPGKKDEAGVAVPPDVRAQEGTDNGHIATSTPASTTVPAPAPIPIPVSAIDGGAFGTALVPGRVIPASQPVQSGGPAHANVPVEEKSEVEKVVENLADKAKNLLSLAGLSSPAGLGAANDVDFNEKERQREREMQGSDPIADGAVGAAFGRGAAGLVGSGANKGTATSGSTATKGTGDLAPPIPATQTGVLDNQGTHLVPESAPSGIPSQSSLTETGTASTAATTAIPASANASGRSTPVPHAGALGAGTSDAVLTPSEAAVAQQAASYMDAHPETGASEKDDKAAQAVLAATAGAGPAGLGAGAYLANKDDEGLKSVAPPNDRLDSMASVTAIRHGQPGDLHDGDDKLATTGSGAPGASSAGGVGAAGTSPLATVTSSGANDTISDAGQKSTTRGTGPNHTTSLTPGGEEGSIGHPPTVAKGGEAARQTGTYPKAQHEDAVGAAIKEAREHGTGINATGNSDSTASAEKEGGAKEKLAEMTSASTSPKKEKDVGTGAGSKTGANGAVPLSPAASSSTGDNGHGASSSSHRRGSSTASTDSKKVGFMKKLKGEMKVISGKLGNNEEKVQLGEKIKHGEA